MLLRERVEKIGEIFFCWRSYIPLVLVPLLIFEGKYVYFGGSHLYDALFGLFCLLICLLGFAVRVFAVGYCKKGTSGRNTKGQAAKGLNTDGIYSALRNPLYAGNGVIVLGLAMLSLNYRVVIYSFFLTAFFYIPIILREEEFLVQTFQEEFLEYAKHTPALIPNFKLWRKPQLRFNLVRVFYREHDTFMGIVGGFSVVELLRGYFINKKLSWDNIDIVFTCLFILGFLSWVILKVMKKYLKSIDNLP